MKAIKLLRFYLLFFPLLFGVQAHCASITPSAFLSWAEANYGTYFPTPSSDYPLPGYVVRYYPSRSNYLGVKDDGKVYVYGADTGNQLLALGSLSDFTCRVSPTSCPPTTGVVRVVLFTHIEDNTPVGTLGSDTARTNYLLWRSRLVTMAQLAKRYSFTWVLQPDWKFLEAALLYEDTTAMASTGGVNLLRYLRDSLGVVIDPHSHEAGGYNYSDVAYLLNRLGVGGATVIGGHVWDPALPQFAHWERFRVPVAGTRYPTFTWRGDILMGHGTPNHTNDPITSGVWRPKEPNDFFTDDPTANIVAVGGYKGDIAGIAELVSKYKTAQVDANCLLTSTYHITPTTLSSTAGLTGLEQDVLVPLQAYRSRGEIEITDFTSLVSNWRSQYGASACVR